MVKSVEEEKEYIGQTTTTFKLRYGTHKNTFGDRSKKTKTGLSKHMWELKRRRHLAPLMLSNYHSVLPPHEELAEEEDSDATQDVALP